MTTPPSPRAVPRLLVLTDRTQCAAAGRTLVDTASAVVAAGAPAILLREKDLPDTERHELAARLFEITAAHDARLVVASDAELAVAVGAAGVHLAGDDPVPHRDGLMVGRSCHDADEVARAIADGVDYVTVSPVAATASKPGYGPALGVHGVATLAAGATPMPVLALGGMTTANTPDVLDAGAHGVAVMGAVMRADHPARVVAEFLELMDVKETQR